MGVREALDLLCLPLTLSSTRRFSSVSHHYTKHKWDKEEMERNTLATQRKNRKCEWYEREETRHTHTHHEKRKRKQWDDQKSWERNKASKKTREGRTWETWERKWCVCCGWSVRTKNGAANSAMHDKRGERGRGHMRWGEHTLQIKRDRDKICIFTPANDSIWRESPFLFWR